jgi:hypothetical protein
MVGTGFLWLRIGTIGGLQLPVQRWFLARGFLYSEDGSDMFLRNVGSHKNYTAPHPRKRHFSLLLLLLFNLLFKVSTSKERNKTNTYTETREKRQFVSFT